jgi:outer membrane receptor protein involved in Fe transport
MTLGWGAFALLTGPVYAQVPAPASEAPPSTPAPASEAPPSAPAPASESPPPAAFTGVRGTVFDAPTGETLIEARVEVVGPPEHKGASTVTDYEGRFELPLPPGVYSLRVWFDVYPPRRVDAVVVEAGRETPLEVRLEPSVEAVQEVVIEARADRRTEAATLSERKKAAVVSDAVSAQEMSRAPDGSASDAVKRVSSTTVQDGRYIVLRGLGGRYTTTLFNGVRLPSPEPDHPSMPLDLFPTALLANMTVAKTYSPELPANFGGGALVLGTHQWPVGPEYKAKFSIGGDTETTFRDRPDNPGGAADFFGYGAGDRALPGAVPRDRPARAKGDTPLPAEALTAAGRSFDETWTPGTTTALPNLSLSGSAANVHDVGLGRLAWLGAVQLGHKQTHRTARVTRAKVTDADGVTARERFETESGVEQGTLGALAHVGWAPSAAHELNLLAFHTHVGDAIALSSDGRSESDGEDFESTRLQSIYRSLLFAQLSGFHRFDAAHGLELRWQLHDALAARDEPDTRDLTYNVLPDGRRRYKDEALSGERFFSALDENTVGAGFDLKLPFEAVTATTGVAAQHSDRTFDARRFRFDYVGSEIDDLGLPPEALFGDALIGDGIRLDERTLEPDAYDADARVIGVHASVDVTALEPVRIVPGVRYEHATQSLRPGSVFASAPEGLADIERTDDDVLPTLNVIWAVTGAQNLRAAYSKTLARPVFRELAPFLYYDFARRRSISGNPDLRLARIHGADLRWEWFFGSDELLSVGAFYKRFEDPIEQVIVDADAGNLGFANAERADVLGGELEGRISLGRLAPSLNDLKFGANLAVITSEITLSAADRRAQTNATRALQGQSPYVVNTSLTWAPDFGFEATVLYNVAGPRIAEVGIQGLPDAVERSQHRLDLTASQKLPAGLALKLGLSNLLFQPVEIEQGGLVTYHSEPGLSGSLSLEWKH